MKRKRNLEKAVILGLILSTGFYGTVWAETFRDGLNYNVGGFIDTINDDVKNGNGVYDKDYDNEDLLIKKGGISFGDFSNNPTDLTNFTLKTTGTINIEKYDVSVGGGSRYTAGITIAVGNDFNGLIEAGNLNLTNKYFDRRGGALTGILLDSYGEKSKLDVHTKLDVEVDGQLNFTDFNQAVNFTDDTELYINANSIVVQTDKTKFDKYSTNSAQGIVISNQKEKSESTANKFSTKSVITSQTDIDFINMDDVVNITGNNVNLSLIANNNINIKNENRSNKSAISLNLRSVQNPNNINFNEKTIADLVAGSNIIIDNYDKGISTVTDYLQTGIGSEVNLYSNKIDIINTNVGINAVDKNNKVTLDDYEAYNAENNFERNNINTISSEEMAVFADNGGSADINGAFNNITSDTYRTIHARGGYDGVNSQVNVNGAVEIINKNALNGADNNKIAVVASADEKSKDENAIGGIVNINLNGTATSVDLQGKFIAGNRIVGSVIAGQNGIVNINTNLPEGASTFSRSGDSGKGSIAVYGNVMAGNNGELNLDLGAGGYLSGRVDDYQDAAVNGKHEEFFNPEFSKKITDSGTVNLTMGEGSTWDVTGQSWVTKLEGSGTVDMRNGSVNETSHAVHIGTLKGDHTFVMDLDSDNHNISDMLFISDEAESKGKQTIYLNSVAGLDTMADGEKLRFATVNAGTDKLTFVGEYNGENSYENHKNGVMVMDSGVLNTNFVIENEEYDETDAEQQNEGYNGGKDFNAAKPGDGYVDENYKDGVNWYLTRNKAGDEISDAGKTIINMSKVNYSNAIYMDRLNKRLGEARYINPEEEQGMWVRLRHDRIGKDDAFRSQNTMYELGYDEKQSCDNGERRLGMAIDYMDGKAEYSGINGSGDIKRYGLWLYDTWLGDKGHYTDYVLKWGHLENDFDIYTMTRGEKVTGDYSNNVFSASAEYGKKNDMGNGWYFEPQAQLQFARVTGADYTTSQNTKVSLDGINSLIGRAGFRFGRDLNENSTVYIKADLLHEFLGEQDITAVDGTGTLRETYENEGTWYDVGFGFATALGHNSYAFMDFEKSFGNDNDETYQINAGVQWSF